ncbi:hypothetical protein [Chryseobacterium taeanense]|nr:hypothetical protein [Chryseobacterium taeanense]
MKKTVMILLLGLLASCDPGYVIYVANRSQNNVYLETDHAIESSLVSKKGPAYDSIVSKKVNPLRAKELYRLSKNQNILLFSNLGVPNPNYFPYKSVKIIKDSDTIKIDKSNLMQKLTKGKNSSYYININ